MALADRVRIVRRYQRAIRIDTDLNDVRALEGFVCPPSYAEALETMARHVAASEQGAFTWTGPYGTGKSSLVLALGAALGRDTPLRECAGSILGTKTAACIWNAMPPRKRGWRILPVVGRRDDAAQVIGEAIESTGLLDTHGPTDWTEKNVLKTLQDIAARYPRAGGGLVVIIDEMGKLLEAAAQDGTDIFLFQQLAEAASRSGGRLIVVGILHQAFGEYAHRLSREMRDEWSKIQGRFVDIVLHTGGEEQIDLLSRAIENGPPPKRASELSKRVVKLMQRKTSPLLPRTLDGCRPLHPVVACLLGPMSRRRFGQNQRSIFSFLNSAEPQGFQDFLRNANETDIYGVEYLWDYLRINLEPAILASPDGHRWALATHVMERCEALGGEDLHVRVLKAVALLDMLKDRSGLVASSGLLKLIFPSQTAHQLNAALEDLKGWSLLVFRKFTNAFALFEGSDFDIDSAIEQAMEQSSGADFTSLDTFSRLQPIVAKRHYFETGALRWFDVDVVSVTEIEEIASNYAPWHGAIGAFFLSIPTRGESNDEAKIACRLAARNSTHWSIVTGFSRHAGRIPALAGELLALQRVRDETPELQGDRVARTEVRARIMALQGELDTEVSRAFDDADWYRKHHAPRQYSHAQLNDLASTLADERFSKAPRLHNELLARVKPSSNAVAARNTLLRRMVLNEHVKNLGILGFPAERGLYASLLETPQLHKKHRGQWKFVNPNGHGDDPMNLAPMWHAAIKILKKNSHRAVKLSEIYEVWRIPPYGIKEGLLPVLAVAFLLSQHATLAFYRVGIFQARITDLDIDYLSRDANPTSTTRRFGACNLLIFCSRRRKVGTTAAPRGIVASTMI